MPYSQETDQVCSMLPGPTQGLDSSDTTWNHAH